MIHNNIEFNKKNQNRSMKCSQNIKSKDLYKLLKQNVNVSFKTNNKLLTVVEQHVIACVQSAFRWRRHMN